MNPTCAASCGNEREPGDKLCAMHRENAERIEREYADELADNRDQREQAKREFRADNRRSVRMQAILSTRKRPVNRRKRGAK